MPLYTYQCSCGREFDKLANIDDEPVKLCICYRLAHRVEVNRVAVRVEGATIPDSEPEYQNESDRRSLKKKGWDGDRSVEVIRKHTKTLPDGNRWLDTTAANQEI